ncbi:uncharacterized protein LOC129310058 [Prosopis cineraria]|uniref:uncharacterized protein LOC129310058 n=1 Tax=Prosopis cineraria TaxID=364024 RepID=UPI00240EC125|nr:uncharacterized protein LOC129310058 [Prosopis cineraria]
MDSNMFSSFVRILRESHVILLKNRSLMASIAILMLVLHSFLVSCKFFFLRLLLKDFAMKETRLFFTSPDSSQYTNLVTAVTADVRLLAALGWFFVLALSMASLFQAATAVLATAIAHGKGNLSFRDLLSRVFKPCKRLIITWFYVSVFDLGYLVLVSMSIFTFTVNFASPYRPTTFVYVILIPVLAFLIFLAVVWSMSVVISVLEEKSGLESIGKASQILKGLKGQGFLLNLVYGAIALMVHIWWYLVTKKKGTYDSLFLALILVNVTCLIKMSHMMAFTVFYHICMFNHGEEVELQGSLEYTKLPNEPMLIGAGAP